MICFFIYSLQSGAHHLVDEGADFLNKAVKELSETIQKAGSEMGVINGFIDDVNKAILRVSHFQISG